MNKRRRAYKAYEWRKHTSNLFLDKVTHDYANLIAKDIDTCILNVHSNGSKNSVLFDSPPLPFPKQLRQMIIEENKNG